jgi:hypothetical protein
VRRAGFELARRHLAIVVGTGVERERERSAQGRDLARRRRGPERAAAGDVGVEAFVHREAFELAGRTGDDCREAARVRQSDVVLTSVPSSIHQSDMMAP